MYQHEGRNRAELKTALHCHPPYISSRMTQAPFDFQITISDSFVYINSQLLWKTSLVSKRRFHLSVVKPKPMQLLRPITIDINSAMDQSERDGNTRNRRHQARENWF